MTRGAAGIVSHTSLTSAADLVPIEVLCYRRASLDRAGEGRSIRAQANEVDVEIEKNAWVLIGDYGDNNVSGSKTDVVRKEFERMLRDIKHGRVRPTLIVAYDFSRLLRNRRDKRRLEELMDEGVHLYDVRYKIDTRDKTGRILFALLAEFAIDRAEELAEYQRASNRLRKEEARPRNNGNPGMGYTPIVSAAGVFEGYGLVPDQAQAIRWAVTELLAGRKTMSGIATAWSAPDSPHRVATAAGGKMFYPTTVRAILTAARIAGCTEVEVEWDEKGKPTKTRLVQNRDGKLPAIITVEELLQVREIARVNRLRGRAQGAGWAPPRYLLTGIATCSNCGGKLTGLKSGLRGSQRNPRYVCRICVTGYSGRNRGTQKTGATIAMPRLDNIVVGATLERIRSGHLANYLAQAVQVEGVDEIAAKLNREERELHDFLSLAERAQEDGDAISPEAFIAFTRGKERRIAQLKSELAGSIENRLASQIPLLPEDIDTRVDEMWDDQPLEWRRQLVKLCWAGIIVLPEVPGSRRDPSLRVKLVPRVTLESA
jgi:DNA invertase Pin-like site-specific DNA recombinase